MAINSAGTVFSFGADANSLIPVGRLTSIGEVSVDSEEIDVTTLDSEGGFREYIQGYRSAGVLSLEGYHDSADSGQTELKAAYDAGCVQACRIVFPDGAQVNFRAFVKGYALGAARVDGAVGFSARLRITGGVSYTAA